MKTDWLLTQRLPKRFTERLRALEALRHPNGTSVYRVEETKPLLSSRAPRMEAERPKQRRWNGVDDPISDCWETAGLLGWALLEPSATWPAGTGTRATSCPGLVRSFGSRPYRLKLLDEPKTLAGVVGPPPKVEAPRVTRHGS